MCATSYYVCNYEYYVFQHICSCSLLMSLNVLYDTYASVECVSVWCKFLLHFLRNIQTTSCKCNEMRISIHTYSKTKSHTNAWVHDRTLLNYQEINNKVNKTLGIFCLQRFMSHTTFYFEYILFRLFHLLKLITFIELSNTLKNIE